MYIKRKYQVGGVVYTPYLAAQAGSSQESTSSGGTTSSSSSPEKITGTIKKEIIDLLKSNGIPSDVDRLLNVANDFLVKSRNLSNYSIFGGTDEDYSLSDLIKIQKLVNDVKYNDGLRKTAAQQITSENAGSEVAITNRGEIYSLNPEGRLNKIMLSEYYKNKDEYNPLTNDELLYYREQNPDLAFDTSILNDLQNTIGMDSIMKYLKDTINAFGSDKIGGYTTKDDAVNKGLAALTKAGPDGYYKFTSEEELRNVKRALNYLFTSMPNNAKNLLRAKTAVEGGDPNNWNDTSTLILQALYEHTSRSDVVDFDKTATEYDPYTTGKKGGSSGTEQLTQNNYLQQLGNMRLVPTKATIVPRASQIFDDGAMVIDAYTAGAPVDKQLDPVGQISMSNFIKTALGAKAGDTNSISFGNRLLDSFDLDKVMYDGTSELNVVELPYKHDSKTGKIVPDFEKITAYNEIRRAIRNTPNMSTTEKLQLFQSKGFSPNEIDGDTVTLKDTMAFLTVSAYASKDSIDIPDTMKPYLEHLDGRYGKQVMDNYNNILLYGTIHPDKNSKVLHKGTNTAERWDIYRGNIFIPMENAARAMLLSGIGEYVPKESMTDFAARVQAREAEVAMADYVKQNDPNYDILSKLGQWQ